MTSTYDFNQPFETVIGQIKTDVEFTNSGRVPFTPKQVATTACDLIFSTGYFSDSYRRCNSKPSADKTWENTKPFFDNEHQTWQETQPSLAGGIYLSLN